MLPIRTRPIRPGPMPPSKLPGGETWLSVAVAVIGAVEALAVDRAVEAEAKVFAKALAEVVAAAEVAAAIKAEVVPAQDKCVLDLNAPDLARFTFWHRKTANLR